MRSFKLANNYKCIIAHMPPNGIYTDARASIMLQFDHMDFKKEKNTLKVLAVCTAVLAVFALFGSYRYYKLNNNLKQLKAESDNKILALESTLANTELERTSLNDALQSEKEKNEDFEREIEKLGAKVGTLVKLSQTDPELLKKYSKVSFLNENYEPKRLVKIGSEYLFNKVDEEYMHASVLPYLERMIDRAERSNVDLKVVSAYRSFGTQATLKTQYKVIYGAGTANQFSAEQGFSEHQLGTTVDLTGMSLGTNLTTAFEATPEFKWLEENAYKFGFVLSYPKGNTYYQYEPWHWRFVGLDLADKLHDEGKYFYDMDQRDIDKYLVKIFES